MLLATLAALVVLRLEVEFVLLWLLAAVIVAATCEASLRGWRRIVAGLIAPAIPLTYALGQIAGWLTVWFPGQVASSDIALLNERGEKI
jgi:hypothetical protein